MTGDYNDHGWWCFDEKEHLRFDTFYLDDDDHTIIHARPAQQIFNYSQQVQ